MSESQTKQRSSASDCGLIALIALAYFVADTVLNKVALGDGWQIFWPLNGLTIALLITRPRQRWPWLLIAVSFGTGVGEYFDDNSIRSVFVQRGLSVLEVVTSAALLPRFTSLGTWLRLPGLYPRFAAAVIAGPSISGVLAAAYFATTQSIPLLNGFNSWALSDAMGIAAVLPLVLAIFSPETRAMRGTRRWLRFAGTVGAAVLVMSVIFVTSRYPLIFILYPLLMLVDWMLGLLGSSIALCIACVLAVFLTEHGYGPFANPEGIGVSQDLAVQLYLGFHLIGFLPISILFLEQRRMDQELRTALARTAELASLDGLTGVANRRTLDARLEEHWQQAMRDRSSIALLMIDADHFKEYNDHFGHQSGDECLRTLAATLTKQVFRPLDLVARFGGEEFAVLLPTTSLEGAQRLAEAMCAAIANLRIPRPTTDQMNSNVAQSGGWVTVSIGCAALVPDSGTDCGRLVELSDQALYRAKHGGRNRVCSADSAEQVWRTGSAAKRLRARIEAFKSRRGH